MAIKGLPDSFEQFEQGKRAAVSVDSEQVFKAICDNPVAKAVLVELRHTCYHWIGVGGDGVEPITGGGYEKFGQIKEECEFILRSSAGTPLDGIRVMRILDAFGAVVWEKARDA
jgi:hypothetical protein